MARLQGGGKGHSFNALPPGLKYAVCPGLDGVRHVRVRGPPGGRIVFKAAILGRVVGGRDHDAVRLRPDALSIPAQDRVRYNGGRGVASSLLDDRLNAVGGQHLHGASEGGLGQGVGVLAHEEGPINAPGGPELRHRLGDGQDVLLIEGALQ